MKLYDFSCADCAGSFEDLVRDGEVPACPSCGSRHTARVLSAFSVGAARGSSSSSSSSAGACATGGCCFGGACGVSES